MNIHNLRSWQLQKQHEKCQEKFRYAIVLSKNHQQQTDERKSWLYDISPKGRWGAVPGKVTLEDRMGPLIIGADSVVTYYFEKEEDLSLFALTWA